MELENINGIGPKSKNYLNKLGINNISDLIEFYPFKYNNIMISNINNCEDNTSIYIIGKVISEPILRRFRNMNSLSFKAEVNNVIVNVIIFNRAFLKSNIRVDNFITLIGKYNKEKNQFTASDIKFQVLRNNMIIPIYHLTSGLKENMLKKYIKESFIYIDYVKDYIPSYLSNDYNFISKKESIYKIHYPKDINDIKVSKVRLIYEELFKFMFKINYFKLLNKEEKGSLKEIDKQKVHNFIEKLPFNLTKSQKNAIEDIYEDLTSRYRMNRLIEGDVGSGKTLVAVIASFMNFLAGYQTALMAPTEILAIQHYENIKEIFKDYNIKLGLLTGKTKEKEKKEVLSSLESGEIDLIIGTHALISERTNFKNLGLVITDEQHRFGVRQRKNLRNKGQLTDILYMTATPIPRTFALTLYGDMDITKIIDKPAGRKEIETIIKSKNEIKDVLFLMLEEIKKGRQVFVVSPLIEENESLNLTNVLKLKENIDNAFNKKVKTEILHGKLKSEEKDKVMNNFINGDIKILISTTVIEVGVDIKNATMMVIFDAERFGLATLHQLRGRIGRNEYDSKCILIGNKDNKRLKVLNESNDGFYISEQDFEQRGEGELFGVKQSGEASFKLANLKRDYKVLIKAKEDSEEFIRNEIKNDFENYTLYKNIVEKIRTLD